MVNFLNGNYVKIGVQHKQVLKIILQNFVCFLVVWPSV